MSFFHKAKVELADITLPGPVLASFEEAERWIGDLKKGDAFRVDETVTVFTHDGTQWQKHVISRGTAVTVTYNNMAATVQRLGGCFIPLVGVDVEF